MGSERFWYGKYGIASTTTGLESYWEGMALRTYGTANLYVMYSTNNDNTSRKVVSTFGFVRKVMDATQARMPSSPKGMPPNKTRRTKKKVG